jgi:hypothetical protein
MDKMYRLSDGSLDRKYLRICAAYKLLKHGKIDESRAIELLAERDVGPSVVTHWKNHLAKRAVFTEVFGEDISMTSGLSLGR